MRLSRLSALLGLTLLFGALGFAKTPAKTKSKKKAAATNSATSASNTNSGAAAADASATKPAPQKASPSSSPEAPPALAPVAATSGTLGLFTVETGDTLPKGGWSISADVNKFGRMPGSVTVLQDGVNLGYGLSNRFNIYVGFQPEEHLHVSSSNPGAQLSLDTSLTAGLPLYVNPNGTLTMYRVLGKGQTPGYVEDFPFAAHDGGGIGPLTVGFKIGLLSERSGAPVSFSIRNDFIIPTAYSTTSLLNNGTQTGQFNDQIGAALSKEFGQFLTLTGNFDVRITKSPVISTSTGSAQAMEQPQQLLPSAGFVIFPQKRFQFMSEYTSVIFLGGTPDNSFGARDPIDGVWGLRVYPFTNVAIDAGYRYMLNLGNDVDRSGFIIKVGASLWPVKPPPPPPANEPPTATCSEDKAAVQAGSNDTVAVSAMASSPMGNPLNYTWSTSGGQVTGTGPQVRWSPAGAMPGNYTVTAFVDDGHGGMVSCLVNVRVNPRPDLPPTVSLTSDRDTVIVGGRVHFTAVGADPQNYPLNYTWQTNGGNLASAGTGADLDTTGLNPGPYTVTVRADDGRGGAADASKTIQVQAAPPPPQATKLNGCDFKALNNARVDNVCKRVLDDVAVRLQNEPRSTVVIIGYSDPRERASAKLAGDRASAAQKYLGTKGVDASRVNTRTGTGQTGAGQQNRRIDVIFVPEGATY